MKGLSRPPFAVFFLSLFFSILFFRVFFTHFQGWVAEDPVGSVCACLFRPASTVSEVGTCNAPDAIERPLYLHHPYNGAFQQVPIWDSPSRRLPFYVLVQKTLSLRRERSKSPNVPSVPCIKMGNLRSWKFLLLLIIVALSTT